LTWNGTPAVSPKIDDFVTTEFAEACIDLKAYTPNTTTSTPGPDVLPSTWMTLSGYSPYSCASACRNSPQPTNTFWTIHMIGAFWGPTTSHLGGYFIIGNTIFIFNQAIAANYYNNLIAAQREVALHELGHAFGLGDITDTSNPDYNTVMRQGTLLVNPTFSVSQLQKIQSKQRPL